MSGWQAMILALMLTPENVSPPTLNSVQKDQVGLAARGAQLAGQSGQRLGPRVGHIRRVG